MDYVCTSCSIRETLVNVVSALSNKLLLVYICTGVRKAILKMKRRHLSFLLRLITISLLTLAVIRLISMTKSGWWGLSGIYNNPPSAASSANDSASFDSGAFQFLVRKHASDEKVIILVYADLPFVDMAINFYETSLKRFGLKNAIFATSISTFCEVLNNQGGSSVTTNNQEEGSVATPVPCVVYHNDQSSAEASQYGTKAFIRKMNIRTDMILDALVLGYTVLHSDCDMHFARNPLEHIRCDEGRCNVAALMDDKEYNAGFVYIRPTSRSIALYRAMKEMAEKDPSLDDQRQLTRSILTLTRNVDDFVVLKLSENQFINGRRYFEEGGRTSGATFGESGKSDDRCAECVVVHNNWIVSKEAKVYRFKEHLMWNNDRGGYYSDLTRKYLLFDNPTFFGDSASTLIEESAALVNALVIGSLLNRTVILPKFHCPDSKDKNPSCLLNSLFNVAKFDQVAEDKYREHVFLKQQKVPRTVTDSRSPIILLARRKDDFDRSTTSAHLIADESVEYFPNDTNSGNVCSEQDILGWFRDSTVSLLQFHSLYRSSFAASEQLGPLVKKFGAALKRSTYRQYT